MSNLIHRAGMKEPVTCNHTPVGNVTAGAVIAVGATPRVAHRDIPAGEVGALAMFGGIYEATGAMAIADGAKVWWDPVANKMTTTAGSLRVFGEAVSACSGDNARFLVFHNPGTL